MSFWTLFLINTLAWSAIFCNQVFELTKPTPGSAEVSSGSLNVSPIPNADPMALPFNDRVVPNTLIRLPSGQELIGYHSRGTQGLKIFSKEMQLVASKDTVLTDPDELNGMLYSPLHQKIWSSSLLTGYQSSNVQVNSASPTSIALTDWVLKGFQSEITSDSHILKVVATFLNADHSYLYVAQQHIIEGLDGDGMPFQNIEIRFYKCHPTDNVCVHKPLPAEFDKSVLPSDASKGGFLGTQYCLLMSYNQFNQQLLLFDSVTGQWMARIVHDGGRPDDFISDPQDATHTYLATNRAPGNQDNSPVVRRVHDVNLMNTFTKIDWFTTDALIENYPSLSFDKDFAMLHGQYLLDLRLFRIIAHTTFWSAADSTFDGVRLFLTLILKSNFTVINTNYELGTVNTFAPYSLSQPIYATDGVYFGTLLHITAENTFRFQTYNLKYPVCGPTDKGYLLSNPTGLEKDKVADIQTSCFDSRCSGTDCKMGLKQLNNLTSTILSACVAFEFDLFVRIEPKQLAFSLFDPLKNKEVSIASSSVSITWTETNLCFDFSKLASFFNESEIFDAQVKITALSSDPFPIRSVNLNRRFESFPITLQLRYRDPSTIDLPAIVPDQLLKERVASITETTTTVSNVAQAVLLGSTVALMSTNPAAAFVISQVISTFTLLSLLNGPMLRLPDAVFTSLMNVKLIDLGLQNGFDDYAEDPEETPISETTDRLDVRVSIIKNAGEDLVFLSIILGLTCFLTVVSTIFLRVVKTPPTSWARKTAEFVRKNYGFSYFSAEIDSSAMELLTFVWANLFYTSTSSGAAGWAVVLACIVLAIYMAFACCYWKIAQGVSRQLKTLDTVSEGNLLEKVTVQPQALENFRFLWEGHQISVSWVAVHSPLIGLARAVLSTAAVLAFARLGIAQLVVFGVIEVAYIAVMLKWRWKEDSKEHWFEVLMEFWNLSYLMAKFFTWAEMTDDYRQVTMGTILSWIILSKLLVAALYCVIVLVTQIVKMILRSRKRTSQAAQNLASNSEERTKQETCQLPLPREAESKPAPRKPSMEYQKVVLDIDKKQPLVFETDVVNATTKPRVNTAPNKPNHPPRLQRVVPVVKRVVMQ